MVSERERRRWPSRCKRGHVLGTHHSSGSAAQTWAALPEISSEEISSDVAKTKVAPPASRNSPILSARGPSEALPLTLISVRTYVCSRFFSAVWRASVIARSLAAR